MPGRLTSRMRQLGPSASSSPQNCSAVSNPIECRPADLRSPWIDARTRASSSTIYTVGTASDAICALWRVSDNAGGGASNLPCYELFLRYLSWFPPAPGSIAVDRQEPALLHQFAD